MVANLSSLLALVLLLATLAPGAAKPADTASSFLYWAIDSAAAARSLAKLACERAQDPSIRAFGCQTATDQAQAQARLEDLSRADNREPPSTISEPERERDRALGALHGGVFDYEYMHQAVNDLARSIGFYEEATREMSDRRLLAYIAERLPKLAARYDAAREVQMRLASTAPMRWGSGRSNDHQATSGPLARFRGY